MSDADFRSRRRLLFLLPFAPRLDANHGGSRAMAQLLLNLAYRHRLALLYLRAAGEPPIDDDLWRQCELVEEVRRPGVGHTPAARWLLRIRLIISFLRGQPIWVTMWAVAAYRARLALLAQVWQPDIVQIEYHIMGQYLSALNGCPAPRVLTEYEPGVPAARDLQQSQQGFKRVLHYLDRIAWERFERKLLKSVHAVVVLTERDRQALAELAPSTSMVRIPLHTMLPEHPLNPLGYPPLSLLFVGNFIHPPNVDAAIRLIAKIFPPVQARLPGVKLYIVGAEPPPQLRQMENEHVIITGNVPDVIPYLDRAALIVVPLRLGGGMRVKVLEVLAAGKALVASQLAIEGLDLVDGEQVVLAESDQHFSEAVIQLMADPERRASLAARARAWARANLDWEKSVAVYEQLYETLLEQATPATVVR